MKAASGLFGDGSSGLAHAANVVTCDVPFSETGTANQTCYEKVMSYLPRCSDSISNQSIKRGDFVKLGRVLLPKTDLASAYAVIGTLAYLLCALGRRPLYFGGTHSMTCPLVTSTSTVLDDFALVWIDAHTDLYHEGEVASYDAKRFSDANVLTRILKARPGISKWTFLVGTRLMGKEYQRRIERNQIISMEEIEEKGITAVAGEIVQKLDGKKIYLSIDMDAVDPAFAPAVNTPIAGGLSSQQILRLVNLLCKSKNVCGGDIVEVDPSRDELNQTGLLVARIAVELISGMRNHFENSR